MYLGDRAARFADELYACHERKSQRTPDARDPSNQLETQVLHGRYIATPSRSDTRKVCWLEVTFFPSDFLLLVIPTPAKLDLLKAWGVR